MGEGGNRACAASERLCMIITRRNAMFGTIAAAATISGTPVLAGCSPAETSGTTPVAPLAPATHTRVMVLGAIHGQHRSSRRYSLDVLRNAVRRAQPDVILTEIPPDRIGAANRGFAETGELTEPRARVFPEYADVVYPLSTQMDFTIEGTAGWTRQIADERAAALERIENDRDRASQWAQHLQARQEMTRALSGRGDDPRFIHSPEYDAIIQRGQTPYQVFFDADLGAGGWTQINAAHTGLINAALDRLSGQGLRVLVIFGAWHKYMIERSLLLRGDVAKLDMRELFV